MAKKIDVTALGEILIDFTPRGMSEQGNPMFEQNPGGGPANLACAAAKHGRELFRHEISQVG